MCTHEVCFKILTHTFVPAFSGTPCTLMYGTKCPEKIVGEGTRSSLSFEQQINFDEFVTELLCHVVN